MVQVLEQDRITVRPQGRRKLKHRAHTDRRTTASARSNMSAMPRITSEGNERNGMVRESLAPSVRAGHYGVVSGWSQAKLLRSVSSLYQGLYLCCVIGM
jgi:hypothetical protein